MPSNVFHLDPTRLNAMKKSVRSPLIAATCAFLYSTLNSPATETAAAKAGREIASGTQSKIEQATQQIIQTPDQWQKWWNKHTDPQDQPDNDENQKPPMIDFDKETILIATMGMRSTGGHAIRFSEIRRDGDTLKVFITASSPAPDAMVTMALTYPFAVIAIPKHESPIVFVVEQK